MFSCHEVPPGYLDKWQKTLDLLAKVLDVPVALIMRVRPEQIEVLVASAGAENPFKGRERADLGTGLYCETVLATRRLLHVPNALDDPVWKNNPDLELGLVNYLGVPLFWPDHTLFGTLCVLDTKARSYEQLHQDLLWQFKDLVEGGFESIHHLQLLDRQKARLETEVLARTAELKAATVRLESELRERKQVEAQLLQSQKMECMGNLASGVAHDMNNVLGAILGLASAGLVGEPPDSPCHQVFTTIIQATERGGAMVKRLLNFAHPTRAEEGELNVNELIHEEVRLLEHTTLSKVRIHTDLDSELRPILGDAGALSHVFMNLCVNAVDAMGEQGEQATLTFRTRTVDRDWIEVRVEDTGLGMSKAVLEKAMDPFFTTKEAGKGTGLGLSMVYSAVQAHHGQIELLSEPGKGTCVVLRFPAYAPPAQPAQPAQDPPAQAARQRLKVLVVDDDDMIQRSTGMLLGALGHTTTLAASGEEALAKLEAGLQPDLVILDLNMPGMGGKGALPRLRALHPDLPVLLATGRADQVATDLAAAYPHTVLLAKPFPLNKLKTEIEAILGSAGQP